MSPDGFFSDYTSKYTTIVRNNIIVNTQKRTKSPSGTGYGIANYLPETHSFEIAYNCLYNNSAGNYENCASKADIHIRPLFVDQENHENLPTKINNMRCCDQSQVISILKRELGVFLLVGCLILAIVPTALCRSPAPTVYVSGDGSGDFNCDGKDDHATYFIQAGSLLIFLSVIESISLFYFRIFRQIQTFSYLTLFETFGKLFFILFLLKMGYGLLGVIEATLLVQGSIFLISLLMIISQIGFVIPRFTYIKEYLQFSLPLTPNSLVRWITESSDRYMVTYFLGLRSVGVYSAACSIGSLIQLFVSSLQLILLPELSKLFDENKMDEVKIYMSHSLRYFLLISIPAVFGLSALAKPLLGILTTDDFLSGWFVIPIIAFSGLLAGIFQIFVNTMLLIKETKTTTYINIVAAVSNVLINLLLIPSIGIVGASLSTLFSYFLMAVLCMHISLKHFKLDFYLHGTLLSLPVLLLYLLLPHEQLKDLCFHLLRKEFLHREKKCSYS